MSEWQDISAQNNWSDVDDWSDIGETKPTTSFLEDVKIGWGNVGKLAQDAAEVGVSGIMGLTEKLPGAPSDIAEQNLRRFQKIKEAGEKTRKDIDVWSNVEGKEQTFGGKATSLITSLPGQIAAMPFSPFQTGKEFIDAGESVEKAQTAALIDTGGNVIGFGLPGTVGKGIIKKVASGAAINALQDVATRKAISDIAETEEVQKRFAPTVETTALAGIVGGGIGGLHSIGDRGVTTPKPKEEKPEESNLGANELVTLQAERADKVISRAEYKLEELNKEFSSDTTSPIRKEEILSEVGEWQQQIEVARNTQEAASRILKGEEPAPVEPIAPRTETDVPEYVTAPDTVARQAELPLDMPLEQPRIGQETISPEVDTSMPIREQVSPEGVIEEISLRPVEAMDDIEFLTREEVQSRIDSEMASPQPDMALLSRLGERETQLAKEADNTNINGLDSVDEAMVRQVLKDFGMTSDEINIHVGREGYLPKEDAIGTATAYGDTATIKVAKAQELADFIDKSPKLKGMLEGLPQAQKESLVRALTVVHEVGHVLLAKLVKHEIFADTVGLNKLIRDYDSYVIKNGLVKAGQEGGAMHVGPRAADYYSNFPEFFAEQVAVNRLLGDRAPKGPIREFLSTVKKVWNRVMHMGGLRGFRSTDMFQEFLDNLIAKNKESLAETGKTMWEIHSTKGSLEDGFNWQEDKMVSPIYLAEKAAKKNGMAQFNPQVAKSNAMYQIESAESVLAKQNEVPDINPFGAGTVSRMMGDLLVRGGNTLFGVQYKQGIFTSSPAVKHAGAVIMNALQKQTQRSMELLQGVTSKEAWMGSNRKFWINLQKVQMDDSPVVVFEKSTNADFFKVHEILQKAIGKYTYEEALDLFGAGLTPQQKKLYKVSTRLFKNLHDISLSSAEEIGKKSPLPNMRGWYPAGRKGEYVVNLTHQGLPLPGRDGLSDLVYSQSFFTKEHAEAWIKHFESQSPEFKGRLRHNGVEERAKTDSPNTMEDFFKAVQEQADRSPDLSDMKSKLQQMHDSFVARGGVLGGHHKERTNIPGYMGSEMFRDVDTGGQAFRDAIYSSVEEFTRLMAKMEIQTKLDLITGDQNLSKTHPNVHNVVDQMEQYALNEVKSPIEMTSVKKWFDKMWINTFERNPIKYLGAKKYPDAHLVDVALGKMSHVFYTYALNLRPSFWIGQASQFMWTGRSMVRGGIGPVDAMAHTGKGIAKLFSNDQELLQALFSASQTSHTFAPQFINDLNKFHVYDFVKEGKGKLTLDLTLGEKQSTAADTFSRLMSFAMLHEHFKAQGLNGDELIGATMRATDENMALYGRQYKAPVFQKMGMVGDLMSPLQTFSQAMLGNMIADINYMRSNPDGLSRVQAAYPFMATMFVTTLMAGAVGAPFMAEMEMFRRFLNWVGEMINAPEIPSLIDFVMSGDNTFSNRVLSHGLMSASTMAIDPEGFDIGSSTRWQPILGGIMTGEKAWYEMMPTATFAVDRMTDLATLSKAATGGYVSEAERRTALLGLTPGMYKGLVDEFKFGAGERDMVPTQKGDAFVKNTPAERLAKFLGTQTITSSVERTRNRALVTRRMKDQGKIDKMKEVMADAALSGDTDKAREVAQDLATKYMLTDKELLNYLEAEAYRRKVPEGMRQFVGKSGTMSVPQQRQYLQYQEMYREEEEEEQ